MYEKNIQKIIIAVAIGVISGIIFCSLGMLISAWSLVKVGQLPLNVAYILMQIIGAIGSFVGSYIAVRIYKSNGLVIGILTAFVLFVIVFTVGFIVCMDNLSLTAITKLVAMLCAGALGGILSVNKKKKFRSYR
ncbi:MAG: TIGR04086 family membrane protein [Clostridia bacterium]|nr:TIGR04086 family membrane protein [Clostridia bacterium]